MALGILSGALSPGLLIGANPWRMYTAGRQLLAHAEGKSEKTRIILFTKNELAGRAAERIIQAHADDETTWFKIIPFLGALSGLAPWGWLSGADPVKLFKAASYHWDDLNQTGADMSSGRRAWEKTKLILFTKNTLAAMEAKRLAASSAD